MGSDGGQKHDARRLSDLKAKFEREKEEVEGMLQDLARQGAQIHPMQIIEARFDLLLNTLLGVDTTQRFEYEIEFAENLKEGLANAQAEVARAKLLHGVVKPHPSGQNGQHGTLAN